MIDGEINNVTATIPVGVYPEEIAVNPETNTVYVVNIGDETVSVIDGEINNVTATIPVGRHPTNIAVNPVTNTVYVPDGEAKNILIIDGKSNKIVLPKYTTFNVNPKDTGSIKCGNNEMITNFTYRLPFNSKCYAEANGDFRFASWKEDLGEGSTKMINATTANDSPFTAFYKFFSLMTQDKESILTMTKPGNYAANFVKINPPIPSEYWIPLYGIIASTIVGWSIPSIIGWTRSKGDVRRLNHYHKRIKSLYDDGKLDEKDVENLDILKTDVTDSYSKGKINKKHYERLNNEISMLYEEIFRKRVKSLSTAVNKEVMKEQSQQLKDDMENSYSKQKITETQFNLLNKKISDLENKDNKSTI